ncbi:MAG: hypothetical protein ACPG6P_11555 [Akkermansiaceae bacterium]
MPFQEDSGAEDVPNLLSKRNRGSNSMDGTAAFSFLGKVSMGGTGLLIGLVLFI